VNQQALEFFRQADPTAGGLAAGGLDRDDDIAE
jgi:hypothetical protein